MRLAAVILAAVFLPLAACQKPVPQAPAQPAETTVTEAPAMPAHDANSYAEPDKVVVTHLALDLAADFDKKILSGTATLDLDWKDSAARSLVLDTRDLSISKIESGDGTTWQELKFELAPRDAIFGSKLSITMPAQSAKVIVLYQQAVLLQELSILFLNNYESRRLPVQALRMNPHLSAPVKHPCARV